MFRVALAYDILSMKDARLTLGSEFNQMRTNKAAYGGGAEFAAENVGGTPFGFALRGSWTSNPSLAYSRRARLRQAEAGQEPGLCRSAAAST